jgi:hypothetical protein
VVHRLPPVAAAVVAGVAVVASVAGPAGFSLATAAVPHSGAIPSAGPQMSLSQWIELHPLAWRNAQFGTARSSGAGCTGARHRRPAAERGPRSGLGGDFGGIASLLGSTPTPPAVAALLERDAADYSWVAATVGSNSAAGYQLDTGSPVMAVGGFNGTDPFPTLQQFQQFVAAGRVHWFIGGAGSDDTASGGSDEARRIATWVSSTFTPVTVDGRTLYDLTARR